MIRQLIHKNNNPYANVKQSRFFHHTLDMTGGGSLSFPLIENWLKDFLATYFSGSEPRLFIEVGSFLGQSANTLAGLIKQLKLNTELLCIDTWTASTTHWEWYINSYLDILKPQDGFPTLYERFLCTTARNQDIITPFPISSVDGAACLKKQNILADFIFIDASHEELPVYADLVYFWDILKTGGFILGDDLNGPFDGVKKALDRFCAEKGIRYQTGFDKFFLITK